ncbi:MAG TPA: heme o synthase [Candidatus Saccharimonadales bacterium]|nr:heme o synthase [Candidatus Saccharimonadales bacterium]
MNLRGYYSVLKPQRTLFNVVTTLAGYLLATRWHIHWSVLLGVLGGTTLVVASACAANNCTDRNLDARMPRTRKRVLVTKQVSVQRAAWLGLVLGIAGFVLLGLYVNWLTVLLGAIGYIDYVVLYAWSKRRTPHSTLIGTVSGAVPIMAGYTAATGRVDLTALLLGLILTAWQMSHFYAIGIFRHADYAAGKLPIWPVVKGDRSARDWIITYTLLFVLCSAALWAVGAAGVVYLVCMTAIGVAWLYVAVAGLKRPDLMRWARQMFGYSLLVILASSLLIAVGPILR